LPTLEKNLVIIVGVHGALEAKIHTRIPDKLIKIFSPLLPQVTGPLRVINRK
jgi:hypothetical protein